MVSPVTLYDGAQSLTLHYWQGGEFYFKEVVEQTFGYPIDCQDLLLDIGIFFFPFLLVP